MSFVSRPTWHYTIQCQHSSRGRQSNSLCESQSTGTWRHLDCWKMESFSQDSTIAEHAQKTKTPASARVLRRQWHWARDCSEPERSERATSRRINDDAGARRTARDNVRFAENSRSCASTLRNVELQGPYGDSLRPEWENDDDFDVRKASFQSSKDCTRFDNEDF